MREQHPIEGLMVTAMNSIKEMIDVNTIIGEPIETNSNIIIIPISKVGFGFAAGGSEFKGETLNEYLRKDKDEEIQYRLPFGGGSGAGVSINPVAFLVVEPNNVKLLPIDHTSCIDRLLDYVPDLMEKLNVYFNKILQTKKDEFQTKRIINKKIKDNLDEKTNKIKNKKTEDIGSEQNEYEYNEIDEDDDY